MTWLVLYIRFTNKKMYFRYVKFVTYLIGPLKYPHTQHHDLELFHRNHVSVAKSFFFSSFFFTTGCFVH